MSNIAKQEGLVIYSILPPDFRLEVTQDDNGFLITNKMGLDRFGDVLVGGFYSIGAKARWMHQLSGELQHFFRRQFDEECDVLSSSEPDGSFLMWLRSCQPYHGKKLTGNLTLPSPTLAKDDTIDVEVDEEWQKRLDYNRADSLFTEEVRKTLPPAGGKYDSVIDI